MFGPLDYAIVARKGGAVAVPDDDDAEPDLTGPAVRSRPRRIAVLKPDFGVHGGFERVVERVESTLRGRRPRRHPPHGRT